MEEAEAAKRIKAQAPCYDDARGSLETTDVRGSKSNERRVHVLVNQAVTRHDGRSSSVQEVSGSLGVSSLNACMGHAPGFMPHSGQIVGVSEPQLQAATTATAAKNEGRDTHRWGLCYSVVLHPYREKRKFARIYPIPTLPALHIAKARSDPFAQSARREGGAPGRAVRGVLLLPAASFGGSHVDRGSSSNGFPPRKIDRTPLEPTQESNPSTLADTAAPSPAEFATTGADAASAHAALVHGSRATELTDASPPPASQEDAYSFHSPRSFFGDFSDGSGPLTRAVPTDGGAVRVAAQQDVEGPRQPCTYTKDSEASTPGLSSQFTTAEKLPRVTSKLHDTEQPAEEYAEQWEQKDALPPPRQDEAEAHEQLCEQKQKQAAETCTEPARVASRTSPWSESDGEWIRPKDLHREIRGAAPQESRIEVSPVHEPCPADTGVQQHNPASPYPQASQQQQRSPFCINVDPQANGSANAEGSSIEMLKRMLSDEAEEAKQRDTATSTANSPAVAPAQGKSGQQRNRLFQGLIEWHRCLLEMYGGTVEDVTRLALQVLPAHATDEHSERRLLVLQGLFDVFCLYRAHFLSSPEELLQAEALHYQWKLKRTRTLDSGGALSFQGSSSVPHAFDQRHRLKEGKEIQDLPVALRLALYGAASLALKVIRVLQLLLEINALRRGGEGRRYTLCLRLELLKLVLKMILYALMPFSFYCDEQSIFHALDTYKEKQMTAETHKSRPSYGRRTGRKIPPLPSAAATRQYVLPIAPNDEHEAAIAAAALQQIPRQWALLVILWILNELKTNLSWERLCAIGLIEANSISLFHGCPQLMERLSPIEDAELHRRLTGLPYALLRAPFFDKFLARPFEAIDFVVRRVPLLNHFNILDAFLVYRDLYFTTSNT
ncbi:hypothetical protein cyc_00660 [Cyclospora cayetanensis]|uniref:Peroxisomal membrane protein PEX16 n=1 Tax=Cyclospora cayetanensis TaxID=88456 RepID=A0A1D3CR79_9EIME|nr:hypothetical protein cyc_00660 [Cyclospora cayetanensis]